MIAVGKHTMQFNITNNTSDAKTYDLMDIQTSLTSSDETLGDSFTIENDNIPGSWSISAKLGQTWLQGQTAKLESIKVFFRSIPPENNATNIVLTIKNYDTSAILATYSGLTSVANSYNTYVVDVNLEAGVNYSFELNRADLLSITLSTGQVFADGFELQNGVPNVGSDLEFLLSLQELILGSDPDIQYQGDYSYDEIISSLQGAPISISNLTIISSTSDQLVNKIKFINSEPYGENKDKLVSVQSFSSPMDVTPIVRIDLKDNIIFGRFEDEKIEYIVDGNTDVKLLFKFDFEENFEEIRDADYEIMEDEEIYDEEKFKKTIKSIENNYTNVLSNKEVPTKNNIGSGSETPISINKKKVLVAFIGIITALIVVNYIKWIVK